MSWLLSLLVSGAFCLLTVTVTVMLLRRQRQRFERLLADFGGQQLITNKRLADILLQHQKRHEQLNERVGLLTDLTTASRREANYAIRQTENLLQSAGILDESAIDSLLDDDETPQPQAHKPTKWVN